MRAFPAYECAREESRLTVRVHYSSLVRAPIGPIHYILFQGQCCTKGTFPRVPLCPIINQPPAPLRTKSLALAFRRVSFIMASSSSSSSFNFQLIINNALDVYRKPTKNDLLVHPLAAKLAIIPAPFLPSFTSKSRDTVAQPNCERSLRSLRDSWRGCWPGTTHNVNLSDICTLIFIRQVFSPAKVVFAGVGVLLWCVSFLM